MSPLFLDAISLTYRPDLDILFLRWPQPVYAFPVREVYQQVLELAVETKARYWMFDVRSRGPVTEDDYDWIIDEFYPNLHSKFGKLTHVAYLLTPAHAEDDTNMKAVDESKNSSWYGKGANFETFTSETEALEWLKLCLSVEIEK